MYSRLRLGWLAVATVLVSVAVVHAVTAFAHPASSATVRSVPVKAAPATYPKQGCGTSPLYVDATPLQDFLCGSAPNKIFRAGPYDVVYATGAGATIYADNTRANQIHEVASDTAYIDEIDCPVYGIPKYANVKTVPSCLRSVRGQRQSPSPAASTTTATTTTPLAKAADCVPPNSNIRLYGWNPQLLASGVCHFEIPPDVKCEVVNGKRIVRLTDTAQMAAQDANPGVVDWQIVAWSMVILQLSPTTNEWQPVRQTPWYWAEPTDIFDVPLAEVPPDNWRLFGSDQDGTPALIANQPLELPSAGLYRFQIFEKWYDKPSQAGLKPFAVPHPGPGFVLTLNHVSARFGAEKVPSSPSSSPAAQEFQAAFCQFS